MDEGNLSLSRVRTEFHFANLRGLVSEQLAWLERAQAQEQQDLQEKLDNVRQGVMGMYGDDLWADADVEIFQERYGGDDPDDPENVLAPFSALFAEVGVGGYP